MTKNKRNIEFRKAKKRLKEQKKNASCPLLMCGNYQSDEICCKDLSEVTKITVHVNYE